MTSADLTCSEKEAVSDALRMARLVADKLRGLEFGDEDRLGALTADFADLYSAFHQGSCLLENFASPANTDRDALADILVDLQVELKHIQYHIRSSKRSMGEIIDSLCGEDEGDDGPSSVG